MKSRLKEIEQAFKNLKTCIHPDKQQAAGMLAVLIEQAIEVADEKKAPSTIEHVVEKLELVCEELAELRAALPVA